MVLLVIIILLSEQKVAFTAYNLNNNSTSTSVFLFRSAYVNDGSGFNTKTGKFTCKIPGLYYFSVTLTKAYVKLPYVYAYLRINDESRLVMYWVPYSDDMSEYEGTPLTQSGTFRLYKNDVVYVYGNPGNMYGALYSTFTGYLISADQ